MKHLKYLLLLIVPIILLLLGCSANDAWRDPMYVETLYVWDVGTGTWVLAGAGGSGGGTGNVTALANLADNTVIRGDGGALGIQDSGVTIDDWDNLNTNGGDVDGFDINAGNDVNVTNDLDVTDNADIHGLLNVTESISLPDDAPFYFGTGSTSRLLWETADANANALLLALPVSDGTDIPALVIGDVKAVNVDLGLFNSFTFPSLNVIDTDRDSYLSLTYSADDAPMIIGNRNIQLKPNADLDDFFTFATVSNIPTIYGTGAYLRVGDAGTSSHSLGADDDLFISGKLEVDGNIYLDGNVFFNGTYNYVSTKYLDFCGSSANINYNTLDTNARNLNIWTIGSNDNANYTSVVILQTTLYQSADWGLFDGLSQPVFAVLEESGKYAYDTAYYSDAGVATPIMKRTNEFGSSLAGDIVRITSGTNAVVGWYYIASVDSVSQITLDRDWCTGNVPNNGNGVIYHSFTMLSAEGVCTDISYGAPSDSDVEIDRDGWLQLDCSQPNGRLYWRANNGWHYVDATAGISLPAVERIDPNGNEFQIGDTVEFVVDKINDDGSFHALPYVADDSNLREQFVLEPAQMEYIKQLVTDQVHDELEKRKPKPFDNPDELAAYLKSVSAIIPINTQDCDDVAVTFMMRALADGHLVSTQIVENFRGWPRHMLCSTIIGNSIYYIEPTDNSFWWAMPLD